MSLLTPRVVYRPFEYPKYFEYFQKQNQAHWLPTEVPMESDVQDYRTRLNDTERHLITNILRFFTQGDLEVNNNYNTRLVGFFPKPEIRMMLSSFAAMEAVHVYAYAYLNDTLGLPESEFSVFLNEATMQRKYQFLQDFNPKNEEELALNLAVFGGFMEGMSLFASFAVLMHFPRLGKMKGVGQIVTWSIRDETLHSAGVCELFRDLIREQPALWTPRLKEKIIAACREMVALEDSFLDTCFALGPIPGLRAPDVKAYIRSLADQKLVELGLTKIYDTPNPLAWLETMIRAKEHTNFFENRATEYAKGAVVSDW